MYESKEANKNTGKELLATATPSGIISLIGQANLASDWMYLLALFAAIFKDIVDPIEFTMFLYILVFALTLFASIFIFFMTLLGSLSEGGKGSRKKGRQSAAMVKRGLILLGGTTAELLPGLDLLPLETFTVFLIYATVLAARKQNKEAEENEKKMSGNAIPQGSSVNSRKNIPRWAAADRYNKVRKAA